MFVSDGTLQWRAYRAAPTTARELLESGGLSNEQE